MSTIVSTRHNRAVNPEANAASGFAMWQFGSTEAGTTSFVLGAADGPMININSYARRTTTTAKTAGQTGWYSVQAPYFAPSPTTQPGDVWTMSLYLRYTGTGTQTVTMRACAQGATGTFVTTNDSAPVVLTSGVWTRVSATVTASAAYTNLGWLAFQSPTQILPAGSTLDATGVFITPGSTLDPYFDGNTPAGTDNSYTPPATVTYSWDGVPNQSASTSTTYAPLQDFQVQFGVTSGAIFGAGTAVNLLGIPSGLRDLSVVRGGDVARTLDSGSLPGLDFAGEKAAQFKWELTLAPGGVEAALTALAAQHAVVTDPGKVSITAGDYLVHHAVNATPKPVSCLQVKLPNRPQPLLLFGRPSRFAAPIDLDYQHGRVSPTSEWTIPDGLVYDAGVLTGWCGLPSPTAGLTFPATFPASFGNSSGGSFVLNNAGNAPSPMVFSISGGACVLPRIINQSTGESINLNYNLSASDVITIDTKAQVVTLNGANWNSVVNIGSTFFKLAPGPNTIAFASSDAATSTAVLFGYSFSAYYAA